MEGDNSAPGNGNKCVISIHSLRMEGDSIWNPQGKSQGTFQSTPSAWRETCNDLPRIPRIFHFNPLPPHGGRRNCGMSAHGMTAYFNPLPPHGGRHIQGSKKQSALYISIHSLRMEGDPSLGRKGQAAQISIHSLRMEGDAYCNGSCPTGKISIHSLRMEGDIMTTHLVAAQ